MIPLCLQCYLEDKVKKAKRLSVQEGAEEDPVFCSLSCAARFALHQYENQFQWCEEHGWFIEEPGGICPQCPTEEELEREEQHLDSVVYANTAITRSHEREEP